VKVDEKNGMVEGCVTGLRCDSARGENAGISEDRYNIKQI
jgi:hypothetical protein